MITTLPGFDEASYRRRNPDIDAAVRQGDFASGLEHYLHFCDGFRLTGMVEGFDERGYLAANPDVVQAIARGEFRSGEQHFVQHGAIECRMGAGVSPSVGEHTLFNYCSPGVDPPPHLCERISNSADPIQFHRLGRIVAFEVANALAGRITLNKNYRILDFGCGCGRVAQYMKRLFPECQLHGSDIDREALAWCRTAIPGVASFEENAPSPPLNHAAGTFDVVYSISVFTHLPEDLEGEWLRELHRVTKPGGLLVLTTHGPGLYDPSVTTAEQNRQLEEKGFVYVSGQVTPGLPEFYRLSYHRKEYLEREWGKLFEIVDFIPKGIARHQDLVVCRKRRTNTNVEH